MGPVYLRPTVYSHSAAVPMVHTNVLKFAWYPSFWVYVVLESVVLKPHLPCKTLGATILPLETSLDEQVTHSVWISQECNISRRVLHMRRFFALQRVTTYRHTHPQLERRSKTERHSDRQAANHACIVHWSSLSKVQSRIWKPVDIHIFGEPRPNPQHQVNTLKTPNT